MAAPDVMSDDRALALGVASAAEAQPPATPRSALSLTSAPGLSYFEECPDAILRFDAEGRVVYANPAIERATAVSRWRFIGQRLEDVEHALRLVLHRLLVRFAGRGL